MQLNADDRLRERTNVLELSPIPTSNVLRILVLGSFSSEYDYDYEYEIRQAKSMLYAYATRTDAKKS
jgi:hypothetical protein